MNTHARIRLATILALGCAFWILGCEAPTDTFTSAFSPATERVWIGPDYYANRLMDWRLRDGRLECLEGRSAKPMRTLHLLTRALREEPGTLAMSVRTGPIAPGDSAHENTWTGFLIGVGGDHVDFRISALAHHWPADDGGLIVGLDGTGKVIVRDNTNPDAPKGARADIERWAWPLVEPASIEVFSEASTDVVLKLEAEPDGDAYRLRVSAHDVESGNPISTATYEDIAAEHLSGNVALVSHNSPLMDGPGYWFRQWQVGGTKVARHHERAFGPVMGTQYTLSRSVLKMTAQMGPLGPDDTRNAELQIERGNAWETVATGALIDDSFTVPFRVEEWDESAETPYRVAYDLRTGDGTTETHYFPGTIRRPPTHRKPAQLRLRARSQLLQGLTHRLGRMGLVSVVVRSTELTRRLHARSPTASKRSTSIKQSITCRSAGFRAPTRHEPPDTVTSHAQEAQKRTHQARFDAF
ncbi:MAG: hypothetical protein IH820_08685, partial [Bacteroidetes bacterium]|nr:hypothetical protein [Bacteroidota bacterium]